MRSKKLRITLYHTADVIPGKSPSVILKLCIYYTWTDPVIQIRQNSVWQNSVPFNLQSKSHVGSNNFSYFQRY